MHGANGLHRSVVSNAKPVSVGCFESTEVRVAVVGERDGSVLPATGKACSRARAVHRSGVVRSTDESGARSAKTVSVEAVYGRN